MSPLKDQGGYAVANNYGGFLKQASMIANDVYFIVVRRFGGASVLTTNRRDIQTIFF